MYQIDKNQNNILSIKEATFASLHYKERENLQEWIAKNPNIFGEDLLIIQKEFDGFSDTRERLDLLAIDKEGNLVVIENKLDDTGRDVVWQALKYASYCSTLRKDQVIAMYQEYLNKYEKGKEARKMLEDFFDSEDFDEIEFNKSQSQRIIFVAAKHRKEVTSTALWLMNFGLRMQCFKATIYVQGDQHLLTVEQIIPVKEAEDYIISMANKQQEEVIQKSSDKKRHSIRKSFWEKLLPALNKKTDLFSNVNSTTDHWISAGSGISGVPYSLVATRSYVAIELYPGHRPTAEENRIIFDKLYAHKEEIEKEFGHQLNWDPLEGKKATRISYALEGVSIFNEEDRQKMIDFLCTYTAKLYTVMDPYLMKIRKEIK
ncbi:DUF4268 domain-containing protein [Candidatus Gracilibacteria bacterium]|nr:DUF4268 domain-containing protein [Candidatus Gracilibacteria bacterium]